MIFEEIQAEVERLVSSKRILASTFELMIEDHKRKAGGTVFTNCQHPYNACNCNGCVAIRAYGRKCMKLRRIEKGIRSEDFCHWGPNWSPSTEEYYSALNEVNILRNIKNREIVRVSV